MKEVTLNSQNYFIKIYIIERYCYVDRDTFSLLNLPNEEERNVIDNKYIQLTYQEMLNLINEYNNAKQSVR